MNLDWISWVISNVGGKMGTIEIRTFEGCQTARKLIDDLRRLEREGNFDLRETIVSDAGKAEAMGLYGSPTIVVNGAIYQQDENGNPGFY